MIPILFEYNVTTFTGSGLGYLMDCISCVVKENSSYQSELEMSYPINGRLFSEIKINRIIVAKRNGFTNYTYNGCEPFRIYGIDKGVSGRISVKAEHISYDLTSVLFFPYDEIYTSQEGYYGKAILNAVSNAFTSSDGLIRAINNSNFITNPNSIPFTLTETNSTHVSYKGVTVDKPRPLRSVLFDSSDSLIGVFGGQCQIRGYNIQYDPDPVVNIRSDYKIDYGTNIIDLQQEENISSMYTCVLPYYINELDKNYDIPGDNVQKNIYPSAIVGSVQYASGTFERHRIYSLDLSSDIDQMYQTQDIVYGDDVPGPNMIPTYAAVNYFGARWAEINKIGIPEVNITVENFDFCSDAQIFDIFPIRFVKLGIVVDSMVTSIEYDCLNEKYKNIEFGKTKDEKMWSAWHKEFQPSESLW